MNPYIWSHSCFALVIGQESKWRRNILFWGALNPSTSWRRKRQHHRNSWYGPCCVMLLHLMNLCPCQLCNYLQFGDLFLIWYGDCCRVSMDYWFFENQRGHDCHWCSSRCWQLLELVFIYCIDDYFLRWSGCNALRIYCLFSKNLISRFLARWNIQACSCLNNFDHSWHPLPFLLQFPGIWCALRPSEQRKWARAGCLWTSSTAFCLPTESMARCLGFPST